MKKIIFVLLIIAAFLGSCQSYEDGPLISFRSAKNRITGTWEIDKFYIDSIDSTDYYHTKLGCELEFTDELYTTSDEIWTIKLINCNNTSNDFKGLWEFSGDSKEIITICFANDSNFTNIVGTFEPGLGTYWKISRLTNNEFNLSTDAWDFNWNLGMRHFDLYLSK
jgi:hypothetical protein